MRKPSFPDSHSNRSCYSNLSTTTDSDPNSNSYIHPFTNPDCCIATTNPYPNSKLPSGTGLW